MKPPLGAAADLSHQATILTRVRHRPATRGRAVPRRRASPIGPAFFWILSGRDPRALDQRELAIDFLRLAARATP